MDIHVAFFKVKTVGEVMDVRRMYKDLRFFLIKEGYADTNASTFPEMYFWQEETMKLGKTFWIWWRPEKGVGIFSVGMKKFITRKLKINIHGMKMKEIEIMHQGKKIKVVKGSLEIYVHAILHFEMGDWETGNAFKQSLFEIFWKRLYLKKIEAYKKEVLNDSYKIQAYLKRVLNLETWTAEHEEYFAKFGIPDTEF